MTAGELLVLTNELGISLYLKDGNLAVRSKKGTLSPELKFAIKEHKAEIIALLSQNQKLSQESNKSVLRKLGLSKAELSFAQQRLWFLDKFESGSSNYNMPTPLRINGDLDLDVAQQAIRAIIQRHEILRTVYLDEGGKPYQQVNERFDFHIKRYDLCAFDGAEKEQKLEQLITDESFKPFDLERDLMVRVCWIQLSSKLEKQEGVLLFNMHHIASDGWSMNVLVEEFNALYQGIKKGVDSPLTPLKLQYSDFATWQREWLKGEVFEAQLSYWKERLQGAPLAHGLPLSYPRPDKKEHVADLVLGKMDEETSAALLDLAKEHKITPFMLLHAALALVFSRNSNSYDIVLGCQVANRQQSELESLIGFFGNTLVLRANTNFDSLTDYMAHIRDCNLEALSNQGIPFDQLIEHLNIPRNTDHSPLVQIILTMEVTQDNDLEGDDLSVKLIVERETRAKFDIDISALVMGGRFCFNWTYDSSIFSREYIEQLNKHLKTALSSFVLTPNLPLKELPILTEQEVDGLLHETPLPVSSFTGEPFIHQLFERQVAEHPLYVAGICNEQQLTYSELNRKANQLARYLKQQGVGPDSLVAIYLDRDLTMLTAILAVLKAGGAYVPVDTSFPKARLEHIFADSKVNVIITETALAPKLEFSAATLVDILQEEQVQSLSAENLALEEINLTPNNLAYVIYTSGSTGRPKGVAIEHRQIAYRFAGFSHLFDIKPKDEVPSLASYAFDISLLELVYPLTKGATVNIVRNDELSEPIALLDRTRNSAFIHMTPSLAQIWLDQVKINKHMTRFPKLRYFATGGDLVPSRLLTDLKQTLEHIDVLQFYGPTEATLFCVCNQKADESPNLIGQVIPNTLGIVVGENMELLPFGVAGELCLGGEGIARGYLNRDELTREQFVNNPYSTESNSTYPQRLYKTGDIVRKLPDGNIEYISRKDDQIKIRGYRIELGEIQYHLDQCEGVHSSATLVKDSGQAGKHIVAYVKRDQSCEALNDNELIVTLKATLGKAVPSYMVPSYFVFISEWPLTPNAKVDNKLLPEPKWNVSGDVCLPETDVERGLVDIWSELLGVESKDISTTANFFELGAHSLLVTRLATAINSNWKIDCTVKQVFERQTLKEQAVMVSEELAIYQSLFKKPDVGGAQERWEL
ncbi:hypothetical protein BB427_16295 [Pseudoalteromonas sp. BMB]|uniref:non-ribosomal peptide synthetase n=1 Tax=Pseudoalteromonas sp. BMB TaxID=1874619 RepID=UPI00083E3EA1|nr:non-ribosomal peptide synthetase [Pseudoalteromonas sp. BMB]ODB35867.1 hypothetical protein BB427_16295 [Pseudoalteromonas sp. BMB]